MLRDVTTRAGMLDLASQLKTLSDLDWANSLNAAVLDHELGHQVVLAGASSGPLPARAVYVDGLDVVILIAGVRTPAQAAYVFGGSLAPLANVKTARVNNAISKVALQIIGELRSLIPESPSSVTIAGHSYGGMVAHVLAVLFSVGRSTPPLQVFTTGSPRVGDMSLSAALIQATCVRLMNHNDPVVFFPPHWDEAPRGVLLAGLAAAVLWSAYAHGPGGYVLNQLGFLSGAELPEQVVPIADTNLIRWLTASLGEGHPGHNIASYVGRLAMGQATQGPPVPPVSAGLKGEFAFPLEPALFNMGLPAGLVAYERAQIMSDASVYLPPQYLPVGKTVQGKSAVYWFGQPMISTDSLSNARTIAKYLRRWLRYSQRAQEWDQGVFDSAIIEYLAVASSPTSGFTPVLNVKY